MFFSKKHVVVFCLLICAIFSVVYCSLAIYLGNHVYLDTKKPSDSILVLGAKAYRGNSYNLCLVSRVSHGVELYKKKYASKILFSGGTDSEDRVNEAETMKKIAIGMGVPPEDILLEQASTSTYENLLLSQNILQSKELKSVVIVTEPFHSPRASLVAKKLGMSYTLSPATDSTCWTRWRYVSRYFLKEPLAVLLYALKGNI